MAVNVNGNQVSVTSSQGDTLRSDALWQAALTNKAQGNAALIAWWQGLTAAQKQAFVFSILLKIVELDTRLKSLGG